MEHELRAHARAIFEAACGRPYARGRCRHRGEYYASLDAAGAHDAAPELLFLRRLSVYPRHVVSPRPGEPGFKLWLWVGRNGRTTRRAKGLGSTHLPTGHNACGILPDLHGRRERGPPQRFKVLLLSKVLNMIDKLPGGFYTPQKASTFLPMRPSVKRHGRATTQ
jgi:hypothetical protein